MKKLLILTVLLLTSITTNAQDSSNDATWEETVEFLKENLQYVKGIWLNDKSIKFSTDIKNDIIYLRASTGIVYRDGTEDYTTVEAPLKKVSDLRFYEERNLFGIFYTGDYSILYHNSQNYTRKKHSTYLTFDKDLAPRMVKAFQHIAYLNKERRKKSKF